MSSDLDWVDLFDEAYKNALVYGTGFIKVTVNSPQGLQMSVVDPKDYFHLGEEPPKEQPVGYLCENAVGHKYFRLKKPSSVYKPIALYAEKS